MDCVTSSHLLSPWYDPELGLQSERRCVVPVSV